MHREMDLHSLEDRIMLPCVYEIYKVMHNMSTLYVGSKFTYTSRIGGINIDWTWVHDDVKMSINMYSGFKIKLYEISYYWLG